MVLVNARLGIVFETSSNVVTFYGRSKTRFKKKHLSLYDIGKGLAEGYDRQADMQKS